METGKRMSADEMSLSETQQRAGWFVERITKGPHQDKRGAAMLRCSPNMFWRLKRGEGWTVERLSLAAKVFGHSFVDVVFGPLTGQAGGPSHALAAEIEQLENVVSRLATAWRRGPMDTGAAGVVDRGTVRPAVVGAVKAGASHGEGSNGSRLRGCDSARHPVMAQSIKRAAE